MRCCSPGEFTNCGAGIGAQVYGAIGLGNIGFTRVKSLPRLVVTLLRSGGAGGVAGWVWGAAGGIPGAVAGCPGACACACMDRDAADVRAASASVAITPRVFPIILVPFPSFMIWAEHTIVKCRSQL